MKRGAIFICLMLIIFLPACDSETEGNPEGISAESILTESQAKELLKQYLVDMVPSHCSRSIKQAIEESMPYWTAKYISVYEETRTEEVWEITAIGFDAKGTIPLEDFWDPNPERFNLEGIWRVYERFNRVGAHNEYAQYFKFLTGECR